MNSGLVVFMPSVRGESNYALNVSEGTAWWEGWFTKYIHRFAWMWIGSHGLFSPKLHGKCVKRILKTHRGFALLFRDQTNW